MFYHSYLDMQVLVFFLIACLNALLNICRDGTKRLNVKFSKKTIIAKFG